LPGGAAVGDVDLEVGAVGHRCGRGDHQLAGLLGERGRCTVDGDRGDVETAQVEAEAAQRVGRGGVDDRAGGQRPGRRGVVEGQVVVPDVVAAVAGGRVVGVAAAGAAVDRRVGRGLGLRCARRQHQHRCPQERRDPRAEPHGRRI
jgi:hypothetical protein